jgi:acetylornithine/N-succinyldiaminopimelate aminotransferase
VVKAANAEKLLLVGAGDNCVRVLPPLIATDQDISDGLLALSRALDRVAGETS